MNSPSIGLMGLWENAPRWRNLTTLAAISTVLAVIFWPSTGSGPTGRYTSSPSSSVPAAPIAGDARGQYNLGIKYANGEGVPQDKAEAVRWFRKAADQGLADAQNYLGFMYVKGAGVPQDNVEAFRWFRKAAEQGYAKAQNNLGIMYSNGLGVPQDKAEAVRWYRKAADQGLADAQYNLDLMSLSE